MYDFHTYASSVPYVQMYKTEVKSALFDVSSIGVNSPIVPVDTERGVAGATEFPFSAMTEPTLTFKVTPVSLFIHIEYFLFAGDVDDNFIPPMTVVGVEVDSGSNSTTHLLMIA